MKVVENQGAAQRVVAKFRFDPWVFGVTLVMNYLFHGFLFTHPFLNHDHVNCFFGIYCDTGLQSGRWFLVVVNWLMGNIGNEWLHGVVGGIFLSLSVVLLVNIFQVKNRKIAYLIAATLVSFPSVASIYTYMFTSTQYFISLFLALLASYWIIRKKWIVGAIVLAFSLGIYQAFISVVLSVLLCSMILDLLQNRLNSLREILMTGIRFLGSVVLGLLLHFMILKVLLWTNGVTLHQYQGIQSFSLQNLLLGIDDAYLNYVSLFDHRFDLRSYFGIFVHLNQVVSLILIGISAFQSNIHRSAVRLAILVVAVGLIPLAFNSIYLLSGLSFIHDIMVFSMVFQLLLPLLLIESTQLLEWTAKPIPIRLTGRRIRDFSVKALVLVFVVVQLVIPYEMVISNNYSYACMEMTYRSAMSYFTRVSTKIEQHEGYEPDIKLALIGKVRFETDIPSRTLTGALVGEQAFNIYSYYSFYRNYLGTEYRWAMPSEIEHLATLPELIEMPSYPGIGSIRRIGEYLVVKFSDPE